MTTNKQNITVITITYNSAKHIQKLLKSLDQVSHRIKKIIVIENNSPEKDQTIKLVNSLAKVVKCKIELHVNNHNDGFAKSCNFGARLSYTKYLLFINPDTEVTNNSIDILIKHANKCNADMIGPKILNYDDSRQNNFVRKPNLSVGLFEFSNLGKLLNINKWHNWFYYLDNPELSSSVEDVEIDALSGACLLIKKSAYDKLNGFDEDFFMYLEDVDLGVRANKLGIKVVYCPHSIIFHVRGASSKNKYKIQHKAWYESRKIYYKKHFGFLTNLIIQPIFLVDEYITKARIILMNYSKFKSSNS